jgi:hypothetical protein
MGRTNPTYRDALRAVESRWEEYRRALRRCDQPRFDRLFSYARDHADAGGLLNHRNPLLPALFSVDLEQESRLDEQEDRLRDHDGRLREQEDRLDDVGDRLGVLEDRLDARDDRLADVEEAPESGHERTGRTPDDG